MHRVPVLLASLAALTALVLPLPVRGQGCVAIRTSIPMITGSGQTTDGSGVYLEKGDWQLNTSTRHLTSDIHWNLDERQYQREVRNNFVTVYQRQYTLGATYAASDRLNFTLTVPYADNSWEILIRPGFFTGDPNTSSGLGNLDLRGEGLGDINLIARYWLKDPHRYLRQNISLGLGIKSKSGDYRDGVVTGDFAGRNPRFRFSDISAQPGDGGTGIIFDLVAFKSYESCTFTLNAAYLANPKDTNGTPSIIQSLGIAPTPATSLLQVNSVPDAYVIRAGILVPIGTHGFALSGNFRMEASPRFDLFGDNNGFRRPGHAKYVEPGLVYSKGPHALSVSVPITFDVYRELNSSRNPVTGNFDRGDATFPDTVVLTNYSYRFDSGRRRRRTEETFVCPPGCKAPHKHAPAGTVVPPVQVPSVRVGG